MGATIQVIGLGSGRLQDLDSSLVAEMKAEGKIYLRTRDFPLINYLEAEGIRIESFDSIYESHAQFEQVYQEIVEKLIFLAKEQQRILFCVPGHPRVAERTVALLLEVGKREGVNVIIRGGRSFVDQVFHAFGFDPIEGFMLLDATSLKASDLNPNQHTVIAQVYDRFTASDVKLTLMQSYPDEYLVWIGSYLGTEQEQISSMPLYEIDQKGEWNNFTLLYLPPAAEESINYRRFSYVREIVEILRSPEGCPWDREQTHESIRKNLIEETYEVLEAIDLQDIDGLKEELGDLLLQILLHSQMAEEEGFFDVYDVIEALSAKLIRRHPHVFGENKAANANEALQNWQEMKKKEKIEKGMDGSADSILSGIPKDLPALLTAYKLQKKAAAVGFDWEHQQEVQRKVEEEWQELLAANTQTEQEEEFGDLLFALINLARFLKIDPEAALAKTNHKFKRRFAYIEAKLRERNQDIQSASLDEMEQLWQEAKKFNLF